MSTWKEILWKLGAKLGVVAAEFARDELSKKAEEVRKVAEEKEDSEETSETSENEEE